MTLTNWAFGTFPLVCLVMALSLRSGTVRICLTLVLFVYFVLTCWFGMDSIARHVTVLASGPADKGFIDGVAALQNAQVKSRLLLMVVAFCLLLLALIPHRSPRLPD